eukprot:TRINITY_DN16865_c0_g1_i3.p1 TRINITY_DN16865_c0_g1~~TRINITY_DN16865_c0_g1_i3.p1  ORF type:complete len:208 (+),score=41.34 TRINITY_DN16865_c0_g1_i3:51-674(+)
MKSGFTKKAGKKEPQVLYSKQQGISQTPTGHYLISSGCLSLDAIIGGFPISSVVLFAEDSPSEDYLSLLKLVVAEGVENQQQCIVADTQDWSKQIPSAREFTEPVASNSEGIRFHTLELNIAWRYKDLAKSVAQRKCRFDFSKAESREKVEKSFKLVKPVPDAALSKTWVTLIKSIQGCLKAPSDDRIFRLIIPSFLNPVSYVLKGN